MKQTKILKGTICFLLAAIVLCSSVSFAFWNSYFGQSGKSVELWTGSFDFDSSLPTFVPQEVADTIDELENQLDSQTMEVLLEKIINFFYNQPTANLVLSDSAESLFATNTVNSGDYLLYTVGSGDQTEIVFVKIDANSTNVPTNVGELNSFLAQTWTGVNLISSIWTSGTLYTSFHAPVEHQGQLFFNQNDSRYIPPSETSSGSWFLVTNDLSYSNFNEVYPRGHIAKNDSEFWIARSAAWGVAPSEEASWAWEKVEKWSGNANFLQTVVTEDNGQVFFWRATQNTTVAPSEASCRQGIWQQIQNAWIGRRGDMVTKNYYFSHNNYQNGDIVVFGVSPSLNYRYFEAVSDVPVDQPPLVESASGVLVLNSEFWRAWQ